MLTLFDEEDVISFGSYMISQERKDSITNHPEITNNQDRKEILKIVTPRILFKVYSLFSKKRIIRVLHINRKNREIFEAIL